VHISKRGFTTNGKFLLEEINDSYFYYCDCFGFVSVKKIVIYCSICYIGVWWLAGHLSVVHMTDSKLLWSSMTVLLYRSYSFGYHNLWSTRTALWRRRRVFAIAEVRMLECVSMLANFFRGKQW